MYKHVTTTKFVEDVADKLLDYPDYRVRSIGADSEGYFTIRIVDKYDNEKVVRIKCWEDKKYR